MEKQLDKLDGPTLDLDLDKEATLSKPNDVKLDLESNCTFVKGKNKIVFEIVFEIWRL